MPLQSIHNGALHRELCNAMAALHHIDAQGCEALAIEFTGRNPIIHINQPTGPFLQGAVVGRQRREGLQRIVLVARVHGCEVRWQETFAVAEAANG